MSAIRCIADSNRTSPKVDISGECTNLLVWLLPSLKGYFAKSYAPSYATIRPPLSDSSNPRPLDARQLRFWLATLSPGDLSINEAAAARPKSTMSTGVGSTNEALWSQMECAGWTQQSTADALSIPGVTITYTLTETGARAVTQALAELLSWNAQVLELFNSFDLLAAPEHVRQLSSLASRLILRTAAQLAIAKEAKPATEEAEARQRDCILALDEISKGVLTAGKYIVEAVALGPESDAGRDRLVRTNKGLRYAEQCLTEWATEMRVKHSRPPS